MPEVTCPCKSHFIFPTSPAPYVRVTLCKGDKKLKKRRTLTKKSTNHPTFNEALVFDVNKASLVDLALEFEVLHDAGPFTGHRQLAYLPLPLCKYKDLWKAMVHGETAQARWYPMEKPQM